MAFFKVKSAYYMENSRRDIDKGSCSDVSARGEFWKTLWQLHVHAALENFLWKVSNDIIPTKANLHRQKITPDPLCPICGGEPETVFHILWLSFLNGGLVGK
jgi:hypothetical protein